MAGELARSKAIRQILFIGARLHGAGEQCTILSYQMGGRLMKNQFKIRTFRPGKSPRILIEFRLRPVETGRRLPLAVDPREDLGHQFIAKPAAGSVLLNSRDSVFLVSRLW